jgi:hypothetical protein
MAGLDSYVKLLIHSDHSDGSTNITDSSDSGHSITVGGDAHHETDQKKFGQSAIYFDGVGDYLDIANHADFQFGGGDFTIDLWIRLTANPPAEGCDIFEKGTIGGSIAFRFAVTSARKLYAYYTGMSGDYQSTTVLNLNQWYHVALDRYGDVYQFYIDGSVDTTSKTQSGSHATTNDLHISTDNGHDNGFMTGYIDEYRVSKGIARYQGSGFTPPTEPYSAGREVNDLLDAILEGKKFEDLDSILAGFVSLNNLLDVILEGKTFNDLNAILESKKQEEQDVVLQGKIFEDLSSVLAGFVTLNNALDVILQGKTKDELDVILEGKKTDELDVILKGTTKDFLNVILQGTANINNNLWIVLKGIANNYDQLDAILKGKTFDDQNVITSGKGFNETDIILSGSDIIEYASKRLTLLDKIKLRSTAVYTAPRSLHALKLVYGDFSTTEIICKPLDEYGTIFHISDRGIMSKAIACVVFDNPQYNKVVTVSCKGIVDDRDGSLIENPANLIRDLFLNVQDYIDDVIDTRSLSIFYADCMKEEIKIACILDDADETIKSFLDRLAYNIHSRWLISDGKSVMKLRWL